MMLMMRMIMWRDGDDDQEDEDEDEIKDDDDDDGDDGDDGDDDLSRPREWTTIIELNRVLEKRNATFNLVFDLIHLY